MTRFLVYTMTARKYLLTFNLIFIGFAVFEMLLEAHAFAFERVESRTRGKFPRALHMNLKDGRNLQLPVSEGNFICYDFLHSGAQSKAPTIVYLPGLVRERNEAKSINLQSLCKRTDMKFLSADYFGVGRSSGSFEDGTVSKWTEDTILLLDTVLKQSEPGGKSGPVVLVGHAIGAWISFLVALKRPDLVDGIVGMSADPDFTEALLWTNLDEPVKQEIMKNGVAQVQWGKEVYPITRNLIEDGRNNLLLSGHTPGSLPIHCPVRLIHAQKDEEVPFEMSLKLIENCASTDASLVLIKSSSHAMEAERDFKTMRNMIREVIEASQGSRFDLTSPGSG